MKRDDLWTLRPLTSQGPYTNGDDGGGQDTGGGGSKTGKDVPPGRRDR